MLYFRKGEKNFENMWPQIGSQRTKNIAKPLLQAFKYGPKS